MFSRRHAADRSQAMATRPKLRAALVAAGPRPRRLLREPDDGPIAVSAIGGPPRLANPNLQPLDPPSAFLVEAIAQGLVRFDAAGEIEPALAQSWIVSDDGLRYTFRHPPRRTGRTAARSPPSRSSARLRAALSRASRNPLKPVLGAIDDDRAR